MESQGKDKDPGPGVGSGQGRGTYTIVLFQIIIKRVNHVSCWSYLAPVLATFKDPSTPKRRARAESEEWQWSQNKGSREVGCEDGEKEEQDRRRVHSASTLTPPIKRGASPRGGPMRCRSPHLCRSAAFGGCRHEL